MTFSDQLNQLHSRVRRNRWIGYFTVFNRIILAIGFIFPGYVKIDGERFTNLSNNHPMGHYLEALFHTGFYYPFIGVLQMLAGFLLLIPRTALLGVLIYFPIILNICILTFSVRFEGSMATSPLMTLSCLYLLCWDYHKLKFIFPFNRDPITNDTSKHAVRSNKFPFLFFAGVAITMVLTVIIPPTLLKTKPRNTLIDCRKQCSKSPNPQACEEFCNCIHTEGKPLNTCLDAYEKALEKTAAKP